MLDTKDEIGETNQFSAMMIQVDSSQQQIGTLTYEPTDGTYSGELEGSGNGYTERTMFMPGSIQYVYDPGSPESYDVSLEPGNDLALLIEMARVYEDREAAAAPPTTATTLAPLTTVSTTLRQVSPRPRALAEKALEMIPVQVYCSFSWRSLSC